MYSDVRANKALLVMLSVPRSTGLDNAQTRPDSYYNNYEYDILVKSVNENLKKSQPIYTRVEG